MIRAVKTELPSGPTAPWLRPGALRPLPSAHQGRYGYLQADAESGKLRALPDLGTLERRVAWTRDTAAEFAWTPEDQFLRTVYEIDELAAAVETRGRVRADAAARKAWPRALLVGLVVLAAVLFWPSERSLQSTIVLLAIFVFPVLWARGVEALLDAVRDIRALGRNAAAWRRRRAEQLRYQTWAPTRASRTGTGIALAAGTLFVMTIVAGREEAFAALALVKPRVLHGEPWRLFTCTLLHGSVLHVWLNLLVGLGLATTARQLVSESRVLCTFLVSAVAGSLASALLTDATSVGASGGILGWGGLLAGLGVAHPDVRRTGLLASVLRWVVLLAVIGVAGVGFIDNAAHAGGFAAGFLLGIGFARASPPRLPLGGDRLGLGFWIPATLAASGALVMLGVLLRLAVA